MFEDLIVDKKKKRIIIGPVCPFCNSKDTKYIGVTISKGNLVMGIMCNRCKGEWFIPYNKNSNEKLIVDIFKDLGNGC